MENALSTWLCCLPPFLLVIVIAVVIGRTPTSSAQDSGRVRGTGDAKELSGLARLSEMDGKPDGQIDSRDRSPIG